MKLHFIAGRSEAEGTWHHLMGWCTTVIPHGSRMEVVTGYVTHEAHKVCGWYLVNGKIWVYNACIWHMLFLSSCLFTTALIGYSSFIALAVILSNSFYPQETIRHLMEMLLGFYPC